MTHVRALVTALSVLAACVALQPAEARACSCVPPRLSRVTVPAEGARGFPTDGTIRVFLTAFPEGARASVASEYRLRDARGALVPLRSEVVRTRLDLRPEAALRPDAEYTLEQVFAYAASGERVTDTDRARGRARGLRGVWFPLATFRTASGPSARRAVTPSLDQVSVAIRRGGGDCGPGLALGGSAGLAAAGDFDVLELHVRGQGVIDTAPAAASVRLGGGDLLCSFDPITIAVAPQTPLELEVVARDASGAVLGRSAPVRPGLSGAPPARSQAPARAGGWAPVAIVAAPPAAASAGPAACPHGFEVASASTAAPAHGPWMYGARASLSSNGRTAWLAFASDEEGSAAMRLARVEADARVRSVATSALGLPAISATLADGPLIVSRTYARSAGNAITSSATLAAFAPDGAIRWSRPLEGAGDGYRIATSTGPALVAWAATDPRYQRWLAFALFDPASGAPIGRLTRTRHGIDGGESEAPAVAHVGDRFLCAWVEGRGMGAGPMRVMTIGQDGQAGTPRELPISGQGIPDMVSAGRRAALVTSDRGRIRWALVDDAGALVAGPVVASEGVGADSRVPRIAYDGRVFAVAWETHPGEGIYVAAIDEAGAVSPALRLDRGTEPASTVGIAPAPRGFYASFTADRSRTELRHLVCRTAPSVGPPARIPPA
ncbi:MAG: hypothetical protein KF729_30740 [Sandaracinaceae bacterium]|nr:hypothetical protein [Sandaracinaceae bacterium]